VRPGRRGAGGGDGARYCLRRGCTHCWRHTGLAERRGEMGAVLLSFSPQTAFWKTVELPSVGLFLWDNSAFSAYCQRLAARERHSALRRRYGIRVQRGGSDATWELAGESQSWWQEGVLRHIQGCRAGCQSVGPVRLPFGACSDFTPDSRLSPCAAPCTSCAATPAVPIAGP
jgi:hypothetical protein